MASLDTNLSATRTGSMVTDSLGAPGQIAYDENAYPSTATKRKAIEDYIRLRLGDGLVDVELDPIHYKTAIDRALGRYRQRAQHSEEESFAFLDLLPETQEYILPQEIMTVRAIFRRGIGSVTGTTASQFEPFASGYLNTYMLVAGRVGGLTNYELFTQYQKLAMNMFGGYMNFTWNPVTKKLTLVRKIPNSGFTYLRMSGLSSSNITPGSTITINMDQPWGPPSYNGITVGAQVVIINCTVTGYNNSYTVQSVSPDQRTLTVTAVTELGATTVSGSQLLQSNIYSPTPNDVAETVLLQIYNTKPDSMLFNDIRVYTWIQDYALAVCKDMLGQARSKFSQIAGPQGGTTLNGADLKNESKTEMDALEEELKRYFDGSQPLTWVIG
jgi:hypothetical protein